MALNLTTGKVEWDTKVPSDPLGAATVSNDLVFTTPYSGALIALDRTTGAIVYQRKLPTSANAPIAIAGNLFSSLRAGLAFSGLRVAHLSWWSTGPPTSPLTRMCPCFTW